jgi:hypothetical protein
LPRSRPALADDSHGGVVVEQALEGADEELVVVHDEQLDWPLAHTRFNGKRAVSVMT